MLRFGPGGLQRRRDHATLLLMLFKILRAPEWAMFQQTERFDGSADDLRDGFIHLSGAAQVEGTLQKHFASESGLIVAEVAVDDDPMLRWEPSRGGALFPHLYRPMVMTDVAGWRAIS